MAGLLDALQAASNSAASNVSGPVDALAWLLRKAGVPVPDDAVGGSKWMEQQGLTRPVKPGLLNMAGETAGLLAPIAAAAKAPKIAKGLLQMGENAAAPRTLNPQTGAIVWHGSPHKFDKFDSSKIGTGEGAQAYGHGLYLADSKGVAQGYRDSLSGPPPILVDGLEPFDLSSMGIAQRIASAMQYKTFGGTKSRSQEEAISKLVADAKSNIAASQGHPELIAQNKVLIDQLESMRGKAISRGEQPGALYKVDLPDEAIAKMLDWDKPIYRQAPEVRKAVRSVVDETLGAGSYGGLIKSRPDFKDLQNNALESMTQDQIAEALRRRGIPGVRYLDGGSRGAGTGTSNYVVFPGEETLLKILERNGQGL